MLTRFFANLFLCSSGSESCEEEPDPASRFWDELSHVGLPQNLNVQSLFESGKTSRLNIFTPFYKALLALLMESYHLFMNAQYEAESAPDND